MHIKSKPIGVIIDQSSSVKTTSTKSLVTYRRVMYRRIRRSSSYLSERSRPTMGVTTIMLTSQIHEQTEAHFVTARRALNYLKVMTNYELKIKPNDRHQLTTYVATS